MYPKIYAKTRKIEENVLSINPPYDADWERVKNYLGFEDDRYKDDLIKLSEAVQKSKQLVNVMTRADHLVGYNSYLTELVDFSRQLVDALPVPHLQMMCIKIRDKSEYVTFYGASYFLEVFQNSEITREKLLRLIDLLASDELVVSLPSKTLSSATGTDRKILNRKGIPSALPENFSEESSACLDEEPVSSVKTFSTAASNISDDAIDNVGTSDANDSVLFTRSSNVTVRKRRLCLNSPPCKNLKFKKYDIVQLNGQVWEIRNFRHNNEPAWEPEGSCVKVFSTVNEAERSVKAKRFTSELEPPTAEQLDCDIYHLDKLTDKLRFLVSELEKKSKLLKEMKTMVPQSRHGSMDQGDTLDHDRDEMKQRMETCDLDSNQSVSTEKDNEKIQSVKSLANSNSAHSSTQNLYHDVKDVNDNMPFNSSLTDFANEDQDCVTVDDRILYSNDSRSRQHSRSNEKGRSTLTPHEKIISPSEGLSQNLGTPEMIKPNLSKSPPILSTPGKINSNYYDFPPTLSPQEKVSSLTNLSPPTLSPQEKVSSLTNLSPPTLTSQEKVSSFINLSSPTFGSREGKFNISNTAVISPHSKINSIYNSSSVRNQSEVMVDKSFIFTSLKGETDVLKSESSTNSCPQRKTIEYNNETLIVSPSAQSVLQSKSVYVRVSPLNPALLKIYKAVVKSPKTMPTSSDRILISPKTKPTSFDKENFSSSSMHSISETKPNKRKVITTDKKMNITETINPEEPTKSLVLHVQESKESESSEDEFFSPESFISPISELP